jgi:hypothetical protein
MTCANTGNSRHPFVSTCSSCESQSTSSSSMGCGQPRQLPRAFTVMEVQPAQSMHRDVYHRHFLVPSKLSCAGELQFVDGLVCRHAYICCNRVLLSRSQAPWATDILGKSRAVTLSTLQQSALSVLMFKRHCTRTLEQFLANKTPLVRHNHNIHGCPSITLLICKGGCGHQTAHPN